MLLQRALSLLAAVIPLLATAQLLDGGSPIAGFPENCNGDCQPLQETLTRCPAVGNTAAMAKAYECICAPAVANQVEECGSCVFKSANVTSRAFELAGELAVDYVRACGVELDIKGAPESISSVLEEGGATYAGERASLSSEFALATATSGGEASGTLTSSPPSATGSLGGTTSSTSASARAVTRGPFAVVSLSGLFAGSALLLSLL